MTETAAHYRPLRNRADVMAKMAPFVPDGVPVDAKTNFELHADVEKVNFEEQWEHTDDSHSGGMRVGEMFIVSGHNPFAHPNEEASWQEQQYFPEAGSSKLYEFIKTGEVYRSQEVDPDHGMVLVEELSPEQNRALFLNLFHGFTAHLQEQIAVVEPHPRA